MPCGRNEQITWHAEVAGNVDVGVVSGGWVDQGRSAQEAAGSAFASTSHGVAEAAGQAGHGQSTHLRRVMRLECLR